MRRIIKFKNLLGSAADSLFKLGIYIMYGAVVRGLYLIGKVSSAVGMTINYSCI